MTANQELGNLEKIPYGNISDALQYTYSSTDRGPNVPTTVITRKEGKLNDLSTLELGAITDGGGTLSYTTLLTKDGLGYVYAIELDLQLDRAATTSTDREYIQLYQEMLSTFAITESG